jgi:dUTP diphosphatase
MITFSIQENLIKPTIEHERLMKLYLQEDVTVYPNEVTSISTEVTINQSDGMIATIMGSSATFDNRLLVHGDVVFNSTFEVVVKIFNPNQYPVYLKRGTEIVNVLFSHTVAVDINSSEVKSDNNGLLEVLQTSLASAHVGYEMDSEFDENERMSFEDALAEFVTRLVKALNDGSNSLYIDANDSLYEFIQSTYDELITTKIFEYIENTDLGVLLKLNSESEVVE